ncbi:MAG: DMT family transporter [Mangrovicoccus sp.]
MVLPSQVSQREDKALLGVAMMAFAVTLFTGIDTTAKLLIQSGLTVFQVVFIRYFVNFVIVTAMFAPVKGPSVFRSAAPKKQIARSLFFLGSSVLNFAALQYLPITMTTTIMFSGPIVVTLLAIPILGEKVGLHRILAVCTGFIGVLVVIQPWGVAFHPAVFFSLGAVVCASLYFIMTRMLAGTESNATSQIWATGIASICLAPLALPNWVWPETTMGYVIMVMIGGFGAFGHILATAAHRLADASILAPVVYIQILLAAIVGVLVFDTWPSWWSLAGGLIIIASGVYIWQRERAKKRKLPARPEALR